MVTGSSTAKLSNLDASTRTSNQDQESTNPLDSADAGKEMYVSYCASCHGEDGKGTGLAAPALSRPVPNLSLLSAYNAGRYPRYRVFTALSKFGESHQAGTKWEMPDWHKAFVSLNPSCPMLADLRARNINDYVESLQIPNR